MISCIQGKLPCGQRAAFSARAVPRAGCLRARRHWAPLVVRASAEGPDEAPQGPREVALTRRFPGAGYTFMLAGALKIMTMGWVATGAPRECVRTAAGQYGQFLLLPVGLLLCLIAKKVVDSGLHESGRFMAFLLGCTAFLYFALYSVFYRYEPRTYEGQQRLLAAYTHSPVRAAGAEGGGVPQPVPGYSPDPGRRNRFIIQRQLDGEYETRNAAYYARAPEMQLGEVEAAVGRLPAGMVGGEGGTAGGVRESVAERRVGGVGVSGRAPTRRGGVPSMYESVSRVPGGLDDSEF